MKKLIAAQLLLGILFTLSACMPYSTQRLPSPTLNIPKETQKAATAEQLYPELNTYDLPALSGTVSVGDECHVYSLTSGFTDQMCQVQGLETRAKMLQYLQVVGKDMFILPKEDKFLEPSFMVSVRIKDKSYGVDNFKTLNQSEFKTVADALAKSFALDSPYTVYENETAKYIVFDWQALTLERRYATIINGKMVYFIAETDASTTPAQQDERIRQIVDTLIVQ